MAGFRTLDDLDVAGRRVLVRADLNVPVIDGGVSDDTRIRAVAPTIRELSKAGAKVIVLSHFGRPKGKAAPGLSLEFLARPLADAVGLPVAFAKDCIGPAARAVVEGLEAGGVALLENVRFHAGEQANDGGFAAALAELGDIFVNDAFSAAHRAHASTVGIARLLPSAAGRAMAAELQALTSTLGDPKRPVAAVIGGAKISTKLAVLGNLISKTDILVIGGAMANTFLNAKGIAVGKSLCEHDLADSARRIIGRAEAAGCQIVLPVDAVVAGEFKAGAKSRTVDIGNVGETDMILDIGAKSAAEIVGHLERCRTLLWNGPLGAFETPPFDAGTVTVAKAAASLTKQGVLLSVAGGGDTVAALNHAGVASDFSHVSTAGGAFLEWLEGKDLPGVAALMA